MREAWHQGGAIQVYVWQEWLEHMGMCCGCPVVKMVAEEGMGE